MCRPPFTYQIAMGSFRITKFALLILTFTGLTEEANHEPVVKTIQGLGRDVFDCVDINLQPAMQHPLLKNHTIKMKPSTYPTDTDHEKSREDESNMHTISCPVGTVPILRTHTEHKLSKFSSTRFFKAQIMQNNSQMAETGANIYEAMYGTKQKSRGTRASVSVHEPYVKIGNQDIYSAGGALIYSEQENTFDFISAGWIVYPRIFGDNHARFYITWNNDTEKERSCINLMCPGFVQVSQEIPLGARLEPVSVYGGKQYVTTLQLFQDRENDTGDWWLTFGKNNKLVGYWPKELFTYLNKDDIIVGWGGEVQVLANETPPLMGSGHFPSEGFGKAAFVKDVMIVDEMDNLITPTISKLVKENNKPGCYEVGNIMVGKEGIGFYFGGSGEC